MCLDNARRVKKGEKLPKKLYQVWEKKLCYGVWDGRYQTAFAGKERNLGEWYRARATEGFVYKRRKRLRDDGLHCFVDIRGALKLMNEYSGCKIVEVKYKTPIAVGGFRGVKCMTVRELRGIRFVPRAEARELAKKQRRD